MERTSGNPVRSDPLQPSAAHAPGWLFAVVLLLLAALLLAHARSYYWLCDDAYISFRYARNLIEGRGLVYNPGEYVEGYTNFFWILQLAALWKVLGIGPEPGATLLSAAYSAGVCGLCAWHAVNGPARLGRRWIVGGALLLLATSRTFAVWCTSGLETRQFTFFVLLAIILLGRYACWRPGLGCASLALAAAALTRPEGLLIAAVGSAWFVFDAAVRRRCTWRAFLALIGPFAAIAGAHAVFRWFYYGDIVPNTYWAKYVQSWPDAGLSYLVRAGIETGAYLLVPLAAVGAYARLRLQGDSVHLLALACIVAHAAYLVDVGGDHFEYRPLDFYWPLLAVAALEGLAHIVAGAAALRAAAGGAGPEARRVFLFCSGLAVVLVYATTLQFGRHSLEYERGPGEPDRLRTEGVTVENFPAAGVPPFLSRLLPAYNAAARLTLPRAIGESQHDFKLNWRRWRSEYAPYAAAPRPPGLPPGAYDAVKAAGIMPYFLPDVRILDTIGLCDREIARLPPNVRNAERLMAHERLDRLSPAYLGRRGVNIDIGPAARGLPETVDAQFALQLGDDLWMRIHEIDPQLLSAARPDRPLLHWSVVQKLGDFDTPESCAGWDLHGPALLNNPRVPAAPNPGMRGAGMLTTWHTDLGDRVTGLARSPVFVASTDAFLCFLIAGGAEPTTGVSLMAGTQPLHTWRGRNSATFERITQPLAAYAGRELHLRVFDESTGVWGHMDIDEVVILAPRPVAGAAGAAAPARTPESGSAP